MFVWHTNTALADWAGTLTLVDWTGDPSRIHKYSLVYHLKLRFFMKNILSICVTGRGIFLVVLTNIQQEGFFDRPGVAGADLQTALSFID